MENNDIPKYGFIPPLHIDKNENSNHAITYDLYSPTLSTLTTLPTTLCLNMIVKNESKIITRLLESVVKIIDSYCICDTGSTDNTIEIIQTFFEQAGISGKIITEPFRDFGYNRTFSLKACEGMENADYILLLDADMIFWLNPAISPITFKKTLVLDSYTIFQGGEEFFYKNTRIVKNNIGVEYWGVTHEYVKMPENTKNQGKIEKCDVFIKDIGDGGSKQDKFLRDIELLKKGLEATPNNDRYTFYLANSYFDSGQLDLAISNYKTRTQLGGWIEEIWYSYFRIGNAFKRKGDMVNAISAWMDAYDVFPNRIENIYEIVKHYRILGKQKLAYMFYELADNIRKRYPNHDYLFTQKDVYEYKLDYELSIIMYYTNTSAYNATDCCMKILSNPIVEDSILKSVLSNYKFYSIILKNDENTENIQQYLDVLYSIQKPEAGFFSSTPSIVLSKSVNSIISEKNLIVNVRHVNYRIDDQGKYINGDYIVTRNIVATIDISNPQEWKKTNETVLQYDMNLDCRYVGLEDVRLFVYNDTLLYNANRGIANGKMKIEHGIIDTINGNTKSLFITKDGQRDIEKNWVLFSHNKNNNQQLRCIYQWYPLTLGISNTVLFQTRKRFQ